jgi:hypothetical protein
MGCAIGFARNKEGGIGMNDYRDYLRSYVKKIEPLLCAWLEKLEKMYEEKKLDVSEYYKSMINVGGRVIEVIKTKYLPKFIAGMTDLKKIWINTSSLEHCYNPKLAEKFVLNHEIAHILGYYNEEAADDYARTKLGLTYNPI